MQQRQAKVVLVDDHPLMIDSLVTMLKEHDDFEVAGTFTKWDDDTCQSVKALAPDLLIFDIEMPGRSPIDDLENLSSLQTRLMILSGFLCDQYISQALSAKVRGYLMKTTSPEDIFKSLKKVMAGQLIYSPEVEARMTNVRRDKGTKRDRLTPREIEVLRCIARGMPAKEIAKALNISVRTVDRHKANIMDKLEIHTQVGLTRFVFAEGLVDTKTLQIPVNS